MARKCTLYESCPLRLFYDTVKGDGSWERRYCIGRFEKCARFGMEKMTGLSGKRKPGAVKDTCGKRRSKR